MMLGRLLAPWQNTTGGDKPQSRQLLHACPLNVLLPSPAQQLAGTLHLECQLCTRPQKQSVQRRLEREPPTAWLAMDA